MSDAKAIFFHALELGCDSKIRDYLDQACSEPDLRREVESLLQAHGEVGDFLGGNAEEETQHHVSERPGETIGAYRLMEQIGEGGMGVVFVAEQQKPLRRKVALKVIKPGMDTKSVIARFEAERQALALMDHPNIAKVLDAGATDQGRPFFVMELVSGIPITDYCDEYKLTIRERLALFIQVCRAIQHAHQKGIIHRDIKPSNVLITELDGKPIPKVIDFGVAKALHQTLTERSIYTSFQSVIGTPLYMSPEQASLSAVDVDTRSDVYSLGVLLYELLTGTTPFDLKELQQVAQDEVLKFIRDQEPPRPSNRISTLGDTATQISQVRRSNPDQLGRQVKGDLDWIVMKALEKERSRRYRTADGLASDIDRHLQDEPVEARPPSTAYRLSRIYRRNRAGVWAAVVMLALLVIGVAGTTIGWIRAEAVLQELREVLTARALDAAFSGDFDVAKEAIEQARKAQFPKDLTDSLLGVSMLIAGQSDKAIQHLKKVVKLEPDSLTALSALSWAYLHEARYGDHESCHHQIQTLQKDYKAITAYDRMFVGLSESIDGDAKKLQKNLREIDDLISQRRNWGAAYLLRAKIRAELAVEDHSIEMFTRAIGDFDTADRILNGSPFATSEGLVIMLQAISLAKHQDETDKLDDWMSKAGDLVDRLNTSNTNSLGLSGVATFHFCYGDKSRARQIEEYLIGQGDKGLVRTTAEWWAYSKSHVPIKEWRRDKDSEVKQQCLALTLACSEPDSADLAEIKQLVDEILAKNIPNSGYALLMDVPLVLGDKQMLARIYDKATQNEFFETDYRWWQRYIKFHGGEINEKDFLAMAGPYHTSSSFAYYGIAMKALSRGDLDKAKEYFDKTVQTGTVTYWCYHNAKAFKKKLAQGWIPNAKRNK